MSTANLESTRYQNVQIVTSFLIDENNNEATDATTESPASGLFVSPSTVLGRAADITGFLVTSENEYGKFEWTDPDGFLSLNQLSDVTITSPAANNLLAYNGTLWVNVSDITVGTATVTTLTDGTLSITGGNVTGAGSITATTFTDGTATLTGGDLTAVDSVVITKGDVAQATSITTAVAIAGGETAGTITTQLASAVANASHTFTVTNASVTATSVVQVGLASYAGTGIPYPTVNAVGAGTFDIVIFNVDSAAALNAVMDITYLIL